MKNLHLNCGLNCLSMYGPRNYERSLDRSLKNQLCFLELSSQRPLVVGTQALVAAGHVTISPSKTAGWVGTQVHVVESKFVNVTIRNPVAPPFQQIFLLSRFWVVT